MRLAVSFPGCYRRGGVERVVLETANHFAGRDHDVHLFASEVDDRAIDPRVTVHAVDYGPRTTMSRVRRFPDACERAMRLSGLRFDAHAAFGVMSPPGGTVWVGSVHAAWLKISRARRDLPGRLRQMANPYHRYILRLEQRIFGQRRYRRLVALTDQVQRDLVDHYAVPEADIDILGNGYAESEFSIERHGAERDGVRAELGLTPEHRAVVFVANETERKGLGPLLDAIARLDDANVHLIAVGRLDAARYARRIAQLGLTGRVHWTGPTDDVSRYYAAADVFALPTQYEAWGLVIIEAMACGLPVLTSRLAGAAVAVDEGRNGERLDDPWDVNEISTKLRRLLDGQHADNATIAATVDTYRWSQVLDRYAEILFAAAPVTA